MKLTILRRAYSGPQASYVLGGAALGAAAAIATIAIATLDAEPATVRDLLAVVFALWTLGWALAPAYGGAPVLRVEHFALQPVPRRRLALALLGAACVGVAAVVTLVAFGALIVFGARLGAVEVALAVVGVALQMALAVVLSRLAGRGFGALARSRLGGAVSALITAIMLVAASSGWIVFVALEAVLESGFSAGFSAALKPLPSSWAVLAVEAASPLPLLGLATLVALLVLA
jgi:ABC-2 type transport system permease protein